MSRDDGELHGLVSVDGLVGPGDPVGRNSPRADVVVPGVVACLVEVLPLPDRPPLGPDHAADLSLHHHRGSS